jgi:hypothetical protein
MVVRRLENTAIEMSVERLVESFSKIKLRNNCIHFTTAPLIQKV